VSALSFVHHFRPGQTPGAPTLLLLHGTGGNEQDLLPLAKILAPDAGVLTSCAAVAVAKSRSVPSSPAVATRRLSRSNARSRTASW